MKIQGITIELNGDASGLNKALDNANKSVKTTQNELKQVEKLLKFDPKNTELLAQKQELLKKRVTDTEDKLKDLHEIEQSLKDSGVEENTEQFMALRREIIDTENALQRAKDAQDDFSIAGTKLSETFSEISEKAGNVAEKTAGLSKVATGVLGAVAGVGVASIKAFSEYEQLEGGVETLFGKNAEQVLKNADKAYKTAGLSANDYIETVTGFSASLIQSLEGDTEKSAELADKAITDMSDNANKMGSDIKSLQSAYAGFAKQQYTLLDNLKLGYGGTKTEMERLLKDATALSGVEYDIQSYSDIIEAIHVIQDNLGITGTTAKEASTTIQGSIGQTKSAIENLVASFATSGADVQGAIDAVVNSVGDVIDNILPVIQTLWDNIPLGGQIALMITGITAVISPMAKAISNVTSVLGGLGKAVPKIIEFATNNPVLLIASAVLTLAGIIIANWDKIKPVLDAIWEKVKAIGTAIKDFVVDTINFLISIVEGGINGIIKILNTYIAVIDKVIGAVGGLFGKEWGGISQINEVSLGRLGEGANALNEPASGSSNRGTTTNVTNITNNTANKPIQLEVNLDGTAMARAMYEPMNQVSNYKGGSLVGR